MKKKRRSRRHQRWLNRPVIWRRPTDATPDPMMRQRCRWPMWAWLAATIASHALVLAGTGHASRSMTRRAAPLTVTIAEPSPAPIKTETKPTAIPDSAPTTPPKKTPRKKRTVRHPTPSPPPAPASPPARHMVGLSLSATVQGGDGPAFAVGDTRRGATASIAEAPRPPSTPTPTPTPERANRPARSMVVDGEIARPRRLRRREPEYPEAYRQRGLEDRVTVELTVGVDGRAHDVRLVATSEHDAFNDAARRAAEREQFSPATKDGAAIPYVLRFTYHFRIST